MVSLATGLFSMVLKDLLRVSGYKCRAFTTNYNLPLSQYTSIMSKKMSYASQESVAIQKNGVEAELKLPGFNCSKFTKPRWEQVLHSTELLTNLRRQLWAAGFLKMESLLRTLGMTFIVAMQIEGPSQRSLKQNITEKDIVPVFKMELTEVTPKSFQTRSEVNMGDKVLLGQNMQWAYIDSQSRTLHPVPKEFIESFGEHVKFPNPPPRITIDVPHKVLVELTRKVIVGEEDIDKFGHCNSERYLYHIHQTVLDNDYNKTFSTPVSPGCP